MTHSDDFNPVTSSVLARCISACDDLGIPMMIEGAPGVGKTRITEQVAQIKGKQHRVTLTSMADPIEAKGFPDLSGDVTTFKPLAGYPVNGNGGGAGYWIFDELPNGTPATMAAFQTAFLDRMIGDHVIDDDWYLIATGNRPKDRAGANRVPTAFRNRVCTVTAQPDVGAWAQWAMSGDSHEIELDAVTAPDMSEGLPYELVAFIRFRPDLLHQFDPDATAFATPRSWERVGKVLAAGLAPDLERVIINGLVGEGPSAELLAFVKIARQLPDPASVLMDPTGADVPDDPATLYALSGALARHVGSNTMDALTTYLGRVPAEYGVCAMKDATARDKSLTSTRAFVQWATDNASVYL